MILTPIARDRLPEVLGRFAVQLHAPVAQAAFARIRTTSPDRAEGEMAEIHRRQALELARRLGIPVHPEGVRSAFNWDGVALDGGTEAYVILHEIAHYILAPEPRRRLVDFGLGPGPDTTDRATAEQATVLALPQSASDEVEASLLGILSEAVLGQPALASFLDQNWLEGLERSAAPYFEAVAARLRNRGLVSEEGSPLRQVSWRSA
jgi:hypothetical protein